MLSVELFGLPGCGKSAVMRSLLSQLTMHSNRTFVTRKEISKNIDRMYRYPCMAPLIYLFHYLFFSCRQFKKHLHTFAKQFPLTRHRMIYEVYCIVLYSKYKRGRQKTELLLLDEGFVQFLSSISHGAVVETNNAFYVLMRDIASITKETLFVDCQLEPQVAVQRIKDRGKQDRFGYSEDLLLKLHLKQRNIDIISRTICRQNRMILYMQSTTEYNAERIIKNLYHEKD